MTTKTPPATLMAATLALAPILLAPAAALAANLTPPNLGAASALADADLFLVWPNASNGPLESISWLSLRAQIATALGSSWLLPANNLSELTNITVARTNLGLGTAATTNTGTSGATVPLLNGVNSWSAAQTFATTAAGALAEPAIVQNGAADASGDEAGVDLQPSSGGCRAVLSGYRDGAAANTGLHLWTCASSTRSVALQIDSGQNALLQGNLTVDGNTTLGNASSDTVTVNAASVARPNMPAFSAKLSASLTSVTGDATTYTVPFNAVIFDRHGDFNTSTGVFTVPFTGTLAGMVNLKRAVRSRRFLSDRQASSN